MSLKNIAQNFMIDVCKEFSDIAFQNPDRPRVILRNLARVVAKAVYGSMCAFDASAGVRVENKLGIEVWI